YFRAPNPGIDLANSPFYVNTRLQPWPVSATPRRAAVSSFGIGGTNAHIVLEEAPPARMGTPDASPQLVMVSARTERALRHSLRNLAAELEREPDRLADLAFTLRTGRVALPWRAGAVVTDAAEAASWLGDLPVRQLESSHREMVFVFDGDGTRNGLEAAVEYAESLLSRGIRPAALVGRNGGEFAAACVARVLTRTEALTARELPAHLTPSIPLYRDQDAVETDLDQVSWVHIGYITDVLEAVGSLWTKGIGGPWDEIHDVGRRRVPLPTYPFTPAEHVLGGTEEPREMERHTQ
ncbi:MAG: ketoacyl-synthetase C-terminal extension domain-containing protein, partial [Sciscionella sp.]